MPAMRRQGHFNHGPFLFPVVHKTTFVIVHGGGYAALRHTVAGRLAFSHCLVETEFQTCGNQTETVGSKPRSLCLRLKNLLRFHESSSLLTFQISIAFRIYLLHGTRPLAPFNFRPPCIRLHIPITATA